jgi:hypothetical protein
MRLFEVEMDYWVIMYGEAERAGEYSVVTCNIALRVMGKTA